MDGLLLDSEKVALAAFIETCGHFGLGDESAVFMKCIGTNQALGEQVLREGLQGKVDTLEFGRIWDAKYFERTSDCAIPLKSGAGELLRDLRSFGVPVAVATSTVTPRARQKLESAGILNEFALIVGGDQVQKSKPCPDIYLKTAELLRIRSASCLALEDSENGVRSAIGAGMTVIQVPDLVQPSAELRRLGHMVLGSLHDVRAWCSRVLA